MIWTFLARDLVITTIPLNFAAIKKEYDNDNNCCKPNL